MTVLALPTPMRLPRHCRAMGMVASLVALVYIAWSSARKVTSELSSLKPWLAFVNVGLTQVFEPEES